MGICIRDMHTYTDFTARTAECHGKHDTCLSLDAYAAQFLCIKANQRILMVGIMAVYQSGVFQCVCAFFEKDACF